MSASDKKKLRKERNAAAMTEKQKKAAKEAKSLKRYTVTFIVVMALVVAIVIGVAVRTPNLGLIDRSTHAVSIGDHWLSTTDFSYFYIDAISDYSNAIYEQYYSTYGNYWQLMLPFDATKPLNAQAYEDGTWADFFMDEALESAKGVYGVYDLAVKAGHSLTEDEQKTVEDYLSSLDVYAKYYGFSSVDSYLRSTYGNGANMDTYRKYYYETALSSSYYKVHEKELKDSYTDEDYRAFEKGKFNIYSIFDYAVYRINADAYLGEGTKDENGKVTYTDEEKSAALEAAKRDAYLLAGYHMTSVEDFDGYIKNLPVNSDQKDKVACTSYDNAFYNSITVSEIQRWIGHVDRKNNDTTVIPITQTTTNDGKSTLTTTGYYVVLLLERDDNNTLNMIDVRHILKKFEGGTLDKETNETVYSKEEKEAAKKYAEEMLDKFLHGEEVTGEAFGILANLNSADSNGSDGGLYEYVYPNQMLPAFNDWCFDPYRQPGDTGIVETKHGYHVMYFEKEHDITYRDYMIQIDMANEDGMEWLEGIAKEMPATVVNLSGMPWDYTMQQ